MRLYQLRVVPIMIALAALVSRCFVPDTQALTLATAHALKEADMRCAEKALKTKDLPLAERCRDAYADARKALEAAAKTKDECALERAMKSTLVVAGNVAGMSDETAKTVGFLSKYNFVCEVTK